MERGTVTETLRQAIWAGFLNGGAAIPTSLALCLINGLTGGLNFGIMGGFIGFGAALSALRDTDPGVRILASTAIALACGMAGAMLTDAFRRRGADIVRQLIVSIVFLEMLTQASIGVTGGETAAFALGASGQWMRGFGGMLCFPLLLGLLAIPALGTPVRMVLEQPQLSQELGVRVIRIRWLAFLCGSAMCALSALFDSLDWSVRAGTRAAWPLLVQGTLAVLIGATIRGRSSFSLVAAATCGFGVLNAVFAYLVTDADRVLPPLLLLVWLGLGMSRERR